MSADTTAQAQFTEPKKVAGVAGAYAFTTTVTYPGEEPSVLTFASSTYGGPIVMITGPVQTFVTDPGRFGPVLNAEWVKAFLA